MGVAAGALLVLAGTIVLVISRPNVVPRFDSGPIATVRDAGAEVRPARAGVVPPETEAEIAQMLGRRESTTRRCYQNVLNDKHDRSFRGSVTMAIALDVTGHARAVITNSPASSLPQ